MKEIYTKPVSEIEEFKVSEDVMTASFAGIEQSPDIWD